MDGKFHKNMLLIFIYLVSYFNHCLYSEVTAGMVDRKYLTVVSNAMEKCREQTEEEHHIQLKWQRNAVGRI